MTKTASVNRPKGKSLPWPRKLKPNEVIILETRYGLGNGKWAPWIAEYVYPPGCEHDAHGMCTVKARQQPENRYRLSFFKRLSMEGIP